MKNKRKSVAPPKDWKWKVNIVDLDIFYVIIEHDSMVGDVAGN